MTDLGLKVRYYQDSTKAGVPCRESAFVRREMDMALPVEQTAMVLVDIWNVHFIESYMEREKRVVNDFILPAVQAAREAKLPIIHAPSPEAILNPDGTLKYPQVQHIPPGIEPARSDDGPEWPPEAFRQRNQPSFNGSGNPYYAYRGPRNQPPGINVHWKELASELAILPAVQVEEGDDVIATGAQLHHVLADRHVLHLIYAGFATNWCLLGRDYGIRSMASRGYNIIALRECTTGVEFPDTLDNLLATEIGIREIEQQFGFTASNRDFLAACSAIGDGRKT